MTEVTEISEKLEPEDLPRICPKCGGTEFLLFTKYTAWEARRVYRVEYDDDDPRWPNEIEVGEDRGGEVESEDQHLFACDGPGCDYEHEWEPPIGCHFEFR